MINQYYRNCNYCSTFLTKRGNNYRRKNLSIFAAFLLVFLSASVLAQTPADKVKIFESTNVNKLQQLKNEYATKHAARKQYAEQMAALNGWELRKFDKDGNFMELMDVTKTGQPLYYITDRKVFFNLGAANTTNASSLWTGGSLGLNLNGENMTIGEWDGGAVRLTHQEFDGNDSQDDGATSLSDHSTHVAGTMVGLGTNPVAKGMASAGALSAHDWTNDEIEMADEAANGLIISNHSYGWNSLFLDTWYFGYYDDQAEEWDNIQFNAPYYLVVKSAGNDRGSFNTSKNGYDLVNGASASKNALVVAAVEEVANYTGPGSVVMSSFSSWGPTDDGRMKPDISAKGVALTSSVASSNTAYAIYSGTSMAAPNTTGSLSLVQQHYNDLNGSFMKAATVKALAINTAEEAGDSPGPDYEFGHGLLNVEKAAILVTNRNVSSLIEENTLSDGGSYVINVNSDGSTPLDLVLAWNEEGTTPGPEDVVDNPLSMLINDLDVRITQGATTYSPWILDPSNPSAGATTGDNFRDNIEVINIETPAAGTYTVTVTHKGTLSQGTQDFSLVINGVIAGDPPVCEALVPTGLAASAITASGATVSWDAVSLVDSYDYRYRATGTTTWTTINTAATTADISGLADETEYEVQARSNCTDESSNYSASVLFTTLVIPPPCTVTTPTGLAANNVTDDSADISWNAVAEATTYNYRYRATGATTWNNGSTASTSASITGLSAETEYEVQVNAECPDETSAYSASVLFTTDEGSVLQPCNIAPQNLNASVTETTADITWDPVEGLNLHQYRWRQVGTSGWTNGTTANNFLNLTGLTANTTYEMNIRSNCSTGNSPVASFSWTTSDGGIDPCDEVPTGLSASAITETSATIGWNSVGSADSYNYRYRETGGTTWTTANTASTSAGLSGLTEDTEYEYQVEAVCASGTSGYSPSSNFTTSSSVDPCNVPGGLGASAITTSSATLNWSSATGALNYNYRYRETGAGGWTTSNTGSTSADVSGLSEGTEYEFQVESVCNTGTSGYSSSAFFTTETSGGGTTPCNEAPQNFVINTTGTTADISWSPVEGAILYQYRYRSTGAWINGTTPNNSLALTGLTPNTSYNLLIRTWCGTFSPIASVNFSTGSTNSASSNAYSTNAQTLDLARGLTLYPNPTKSNLNIGINGIEGKVDVAIIDSKGVVVKTFTAEQGIQHIDISELSNGIYILKAASESESIKKRFIKE